MRSARRFSARDACADERGSVRHAAHELAVPAEPARKVLQPDARGDADHQLAGELAGERRKRRAHVLRLHGEHQRVRSKRARVGRSARAHPEFRGQAPPCGRHGLGHRDRAGLCAPGDQPADERARHVAATDECKLHAMSFALGAG
jgi:hypothetical protein